jgi:hypothetical protein
MNVAQLISMLNVVPPEAVVTFLYDGGARSEVNQAWLSRGGHVVLSDNREVCYNTEDRPTSAPTAEQVQYWYCPKGMPGAD